MSRFRTLGRWLRDLPILVKLVAVSGLVMGLAAVATFAVMTFNEQQLLRRQLGEALVSQARIIAATSAAAVLFRDREAANSILAALGAEPAIHTAAIYDTEGKAMAGFRKQAQHQVPDYAFMHQRVAVGGYEVMRYGNRPHVLALQPIETGGRTVGWVALVAGTELLQELMTRQVLFTAAATFIVFGLAVLLSGALYRQIARPLHDLAALAERVSEEEDYSRRVAIRQGDELGQLGHAFNQMLGIVQARDHDLNEHRIHLEGLVARRTAELTELNRTLERRIAEEVAASREKDRLLSQQARYAQMGEMLSMIAHQWRQPLTALSTAGIELAVKNQLGGADAAAVAQFTAYVERQTQGMSRTIDDFMEFFRPDKAPQRFAVAEVLEDVRHLMGPQLRHRNLELVERLEPGLALEGYRKELEQVLINLIGNARDAYETDPGRAGEIVVAGARRDGGIDLSVSDRAGGIPEGVLERVFDPYFTTKEPGKGTGIGLYMSRMIVERSFHGEIAAENREGGARFTLRLPSSPTATAGQRPTIDEG